MTITKTTTRGLTALVFAAALTAGMTACSNDDSSTEAVDSTAMTSTMTTMTSGMPDAAADLVGPGCAQYAADHPTGPASVAGMADLPLTEAAAANPLLTTLTSAVSGVLNPDVNLVETLDGGEFTVFAPVDDAFAAVAPATIESLKTDSDGLTTLLTYHVVPGQAGPDAVVGEHETVEGSTLTVTKTDDGLEVNGAAVVCGGVKTKNATVYLVDEVLMPPSAE